jgi:signal transduction histidine kinase
MPKALLVSRREPVLGRMIASLAGGDLEILAADGLTAAGDLARHARVDLVVLDYATLGALPSAGVDALRGAAGSGAMLAIVPESRPRILRRALRNGADALLLDPFDLEDGQRALRRLLGAREEAGRTGSLEALSAFLKGFSHDVFNALQPIVAILQVLRRQEALPAETAARFDAMLDGAGRIQKVVHELEYYVLARKPQRALLDPARLLRELVARLRAGEPPLRLDLAAPDSAPHVLGDRDQLALAFRNLAAFAAGPDGRGAVELALDAGGDPIAVTVRGKAVVELPKRPADLLTPYHDARGRGRPGSLELAAAWGIVRSHRGTLAVAPSDRGGVEFRVALPRAPDFAGPRAASEPAPPA